MRRREFILLLGGSVTGWPLVVRAQQPERMRRIGVLMASAADNSDSQARIAGLLQGLQQLGWIDGRSVRIDTLRATRTRDRLLLSKANRARLDSERSLFDPRVMIFMLP